MVSPRQEPRSRSPRAESRMTVGFGNGRRVPRTGPPDRKGRAEVLAGGVVVVMGDGWAGGRRETVIVLGGPGRAGDKHAPVVKGRFGSSGVRPW